MASAILPSRNGPSSGDLMNNFDRNGNHNLTRLRNIPNTNPNPNPNSAQFFFGNNRRDVLWKNNQQLPSYAAPEASFIGSSMNSVPPKSNGYRYITFRLGSYTRRELKELKKRLISDLERVRVLRHRVCSTQMTKLNYHPLKLELPSAPVAALTGKERKKSAVGQKRSKPVPPARDTKRQCGRVKNNSQSKLAMRKCGQILAKLMRHRNGWVFNIPVDAAAMKLYDYHTIISHPMDLGTIKSKLAINEYESPLAFASDVRLTFQNAMVYNGRGSDVYSMAERLLLLFENMFNSTDQKSVVKDKKQKNSSDRAPILDENPVPNTIVLSEQPVAPQANDDANLGTPTLTVPSKPEMTADEKSKLAESFVNLQLGPEGMEHIMSIVKKGSLGLERQGDEIELDLGLLDNDTLWELHSFIGRFHKKDYAAEYSAGSEPMVEEQGSKRDAVNVSSSCSGSSSSDSDSSSSGSGSGSSSRNSYNEQEANSTPKGVSMGF